VEAQDRLIAIAIKERLFFKENPEQRRTVLCRQTPGLSALISLVRDGVVPGQSALTIETHSFSPVINDSIHSRLPLIILAHTGGCGESGETRGGLPGRAKHRLTSNRFFKILRKQMRAITIIKQSERRPVSVKSETLGKQPKLASISSQRALIETVESWVIERRESVSNGRWQADYHTLFSNPVEPQGSAADEAELLQPQCDPDGPDFQSTFLVERSS